MTKLFLLHSGFITSNATSLLKEEEHDLSIRDRLFLSDTRISDNTSYYDEIVDRLFSLYHDNNELIRSFAFREEILESAFRVFKFKSTSIVPWVRMQLSQRTVGYLHRKYLKETLAFILFKQPRELENYTYFRLLSPIGVKDGFQTGLEDPDAILRTFVKDESVSLVDIMTQWTKDTSSFIDLLTTLHVIFGRRTDNGVKEP